MGSETGGTANGSGGATGSTGGFGNTATGGTGADGGSGNATGGVAAAGGSEPVDDPGKSLDERVEVFDIALSGTASNGSTLSNAVFPAVRPGGGLTLGWNEGSLGHLLRVNAEMESEDVEWDFPGLMIVGALGLPDDGVALLVIDHTKSMTDSFNYDRHLRLLILDAEGKQTRETSIVGGTGIGVGSTWFSWSATRSVAMVRNGDRFAIFCKVSNHRTVESGTHQGDLYIEVDADGNLDEDRRDFWSASHSNKQHLVLAPDGSDHRLIVGDANPYGIQYQTWGPYSADDMVVWPHEDQWEIGEEGGTSSVSAGDLCGFQLRDGRLYATLGTVRQQPFNPSQDMSDVLLLSWPLGAVQGDTVSETWLTETSDVAEQCPTLTALGVDHQLTVWGTREGTTATLALLDDQGKLVSGPTASTAPFAKTSLAVQLPGGDVAWTYAERDATVVQVAVARAD